MVGKQVKKLETRLSFSLTIILNIISGKVAQYLLFKTFYYTEEYSIDIVMEISKSVHQPSILLSLLLYTVVYLFILAIIDNKNTLK